MTLGSPPWDFDFYIEEVTQQGQRSDMAWITVEKLTQDSMVGHGYSEVSRYRDHIGEAVAGIKMGVA